MASGFGVVLMGIGLFMAFPLAGIPGMFIAGWVIAFAGLMAITHGEPGEDSGGPGGPEPPA